MGGVPNAKTEPDAQPRFVVAASADPGTNSAPGHRLQRIQIIKGWVGQDGSLHQAVIDVAGNAEYGAKVDPLSCVSKGGGFVTFCGVWEDPEHYPQQDAVDYARAVENHSCRWSARICLSLLEG